ncbi:hypothetical protein [Rathayibacter tanaceti]|uniref:Uncharacterized protein n=2 Tax=Rathayibacter tanaceti TaxID=1671680 RepID=A0A166HXU4_9MICO|nr:hypothetical protein [Rathayibacter tanaceti]KZX21321.1 hypothetical protein ACH61_01554 [Rathayibacter tanaceti]QHC54284.1 hypothetical protein GSU10_00490 [Rathayibacter tanaceti]TCO37962.1 hypothetical protein EV639_103149 [Rathayibacter tanaceti]
MTRPPAPDSHDIPLGDGWSIPDGNGPARRTLVQGAAWTIPVVALATATPAAAASLVPTLTFTQPNYNKSSCDTLRGVSVRATTDGTTPVPDGTPVTVTLPDGFLFEGGGTTRTVTTVNGVAAVPPMTSTAIDGADNTLSASGNGATATSTVTVSSDERSVWVNMDAAGNNGEYPAVPAGSRPYGYNYFRAPNGQLYYQNAPVAGSTPVNGGLAWQTTTNSNQGSFKIGNTWYLYNGASRTALTVPATVTAAGNNYFVTGDNRNIYYGNTLIAVPGTVTKAVGYDIQGEGNVLTLQAGSVWRRYINGVESTPAWMANIPATSRNLGYDYFQNGSTLYFRGTVVTNAAPISGTYPGIATFSGTSNQPRVNIRDTTTNQWRSVGGAGYAGGRVFPAVPARARALGYNYFLASNGDLYSGNTRIATNVASAANAFGGVNDTNRINVRLRRC